MPFAMADRPSIQCGLLKAELAQLGHRADVFYLNLELAAELGAAPLQHARPPPDGPVTGRVALRGHRIRDPGR